MKVPDRRLFRLNADPPPVTVMACYAKYRTQAGEDATGKNRSNAGVMIGSSANGCNSLEMTGLDMASQGRSDAVGNAPRRTRTHNPLSKSQKKVSRKQHSHNDLRIATPPVAHY